MMNTRIDDEDIKEAIIRVKKTIERRQNRAEKAFAVYKKKDEDKLNQYGYWSKGYEEGKAIAYDIVLGEIDDLLLLIENVYSSSSSDSKK